MLSPFRVDTYPDWIRLGWCLHNVSPSADMLALWVSTSRRSAKFQPGECESLWPSMRDEGLGLGSLHMWARDDNPSEYKKFVNQRVNSDVLACNGSHNSVASVAAKVLGDRFVCATADGKLWYVFNGNLWAEDKGGILVRHELSTTVRDQFVETMSSLVTTQSLDELRSTHRQHKDDASRLLNIAMKLQDATFKHHVLHEMREYCFQSSFLRTLDSRPHLLAFTNGVWDLHQGTFRNASPSDMVSLSTGYPYVAEEDAALAQKAHRYFETLHPAPEQRAYVIKTFARQLFGDNGSELFHVHAGFQGSAGNGKTKFFDALECAFGDYVRRFPVQILTARSRDEANKPTPEYQYWRGRRVLYCTEPNSDDVLNSGIMKDLTGGEKIQFRLLFSNEVLEFRPQYKMHIMCNDPPKVDGADSGVVRRVRKIDYTSRFVDASQVDESQHCYLRDETFFALLKSSPAMRMELARVVLNAFEAAFAFEAPQVVREASRMYLDENDAAGQFAREHIERWPNGFFTLKEAKERFKASDHYTGKVGNLKNDLQKALKTICHAQKHMTVGGKQTNVFVDYRLKPLLHPLGDGEGHSVSMVGGDASG